VSLWLIVSFTWLWSWTGAVEDCNDDNEGDCVGKGDLRVLGAFRDLSKSVGSRDSNGGFGRLFRVQFELDFQLCTSKKGKKDNNLGMKKSSIGGK
jgi:hypothetical protein